MLRLASIYLSGLRCLHSPCSHLPTNPLQVRHWGTQDSVATGPGSHNMQKQGLSALQPD